MMRISYTFRSEDAQWKLEVETDQLSSEDSRDNFFNLMDRLYKDSLEDDDDEEDRHIVNFN